MQAHHLHFHHALFAVRSLPVLQQQQQQFQVRFLLQS